MTDREKLIELIVDYFDVGDGTPEDIADKLIAHGVTFATDTNDGDKWVSVEDGTPDEDQGAVLCFVSGRYKNITLQNCCEIGFYYENEGWVLETWPEWEKPPVSHWMPLPEPPKGEIA